MKNKFYNKKKNAFGNRGIFFLISAFFLTSCYYYPQEQLVAQPARNENMTAMTQIYFYPNKNQSTERQSRDHYACYNWAVDQTGFDPSTSSIAPEQRVRVVPMPPPGHDTVVMSVAGAVLGALIAGPRHAGGGALIGAAGGAMAGAVSDASRAESARQLEEAYQNRNEARDLHQEKRALQFRRAMSACMEGRGYTVR